MGLRLVEGILLVITANTIAAVLWQAFRPRRRSRPPA